MKGATIGVAVQLCILGLLAMFSLGPALSHEGLVPKDRGIPGLFPTTGAQVAYLHTSGVHAMGQPTQGHLVQAGPSETPASQVTVAVGMRKDVVRTQWGEPAEVRKIRVCLGTAEEWVYRGDPRRYGASERVLHFDEDGVLTEIK